jgi:hypothetical protein
MPGSVRARALCPSSSARARTCRTADQLLGFIESDPADFGELVAIADEDVGAVGWLRGQVDHSAAGGWMDAAADLRPYRDLNRRSVTDQKDAFERQLESH